MEATSRYADEYAASLSDPQGWWARAAERVDWVAPFERVFAPEQGVFGRWFTGGMLNTCANCLDRHVAAGRGAQVALIWDSPVTGAVKTFSYAALTEAVAKLAGALAALGVGRGDRVVIYMPMVPEAAQAMLACARLGAVHSVVFGGFAAPELAKRIDDAKPVAVICASCGIEPGRVVAYKPLLDAAIELSAHKPRACLVLQRPQQPAVLIAGRDHDFHEAVGRAVPHPPVPVRATDPLYIIYTSGTTGGPKGIVRDNGGHAVAVLQSMDMIFGLRAGDVTWTVSDVGWVVGHSYIVYGPLMAGLTTVLYEGKPVGTPDAGAYWRVCAQHRVKVLFTAPTALRAIKQQDFSGALMAPHDLSALQAVFVAGERCDPPTAEWIAGLLRRPIVDHWWQTESGWPMTANFRGLGLLAQAPGCAGRPCPGYDLRALDDAGRELPRGPTVGNLAVRLPLPPGFAPTLWGDDQRFRDAYLADYPGWYRTGDAGVVAANGDVSVMGRTDDVINVAGHRLSTGAMEEVLAAHPDVAECAVVGAADALKGQTPLGLVVLKAGIEREAEALASELVALVRERIGPVAAFRRVHVVPRLPKTRSGKILRATIRSIADGEVPKVPPTIEDPAVLDAIAGILRPQPEEQPA